MLAHEVLSAAADVIEKQGWSQGAAARGADGAEVQLFTGHGGGQSRAGVNPAATSFSMYGAVVKVLASRPGISHGEAMWAKLVQLIRARQDAMPTGGRNYVHPAIQFNEAEGRTKNEVVELLRAAAAELVPADAALQAGRAT